MRPWSGGLNKRRGLEMESNKILENIFTGLYYIFLLVFVISVFGLIPGCSSIKVPKTVRVPIPLPCQKPVYPDLPQLPIESLDQKSSHSQVMKAYVATVKIQQDWMDTVRN